MNEACAMNDAAPAAEAAATLADRRPAPAGRPRSACCWSISARPMRPMPPAVRRYLKEFLTDPRVIENQGPLWKLVLNGIILRVRPRRKARDYRKIWNKERNESPLKTITRSQAEKLGKHARAARAATSWSTGRCATAIRRSRRGSRSWWRRAASASWSFRSIRNIARRRPRPSATRSSACSRGMRHQPALRIAPPYYNDPVYIEALASSTSAELAAARFKPDVILASFHGMPQAYRRQGRSLLRPLHRDHAAAARAAQARRDEIDADVPVALRPRQVARARDRSRPSRSSPRAA